MHNFSWRLCLIYRSVYANKIISFTQSALCVDSDCFAFDFVRFRCRQVNVPFCLFVIELSVGTEKSELKKNREIYGKAMTRQSESCFKSFSIHFSCLSSNNAFEYRHRSCSLQREIEHVTCTHRIHLHKTK